jgi:outer membrane protein TolC
MNNRYRLVLGFVIVCNGLFGLKAQTVTENMSLQKAIETALVNNYDLKIAENTLKQTENSNTIGNAGLLPSVSLSGSAEYSDYNYDNEYSTYSSNVSGNGTTTIDATAYIGYTLFDGFGNQYTFKKLKQANNMQNTLFQLQMENTVLGVVQYYYEVCKAQQNLTLAKQSMQISRDRYNRTSDQKMYGQATLLDLLNAEVDMNADSTSLLQAEQTMLTTIKDLNLVMGVSISENYMVDDQIVFREDLTADKVLSEALTNNKAYIAQQQQEGLSQIDLKITQSAKYPSIDAYAQYYYSNTEYSKGSTVSTNYKIPTVGASVSFNVFNGRQQHTKEQNAKLDVLSEQERSRQAKAELERDAANAFTDYAYKRRIAELQMSSLKQATLNFEQTKEMFQLGQVTSIEFRTAQENLLSVGNQYNDALFQAKVAEYNLLQLTGELIK